jgi:phenylpropionate dioxygenase-like ring-hydroxylating dioxygenase large terminal subunit
MFINFWYAAFRSRALGATPVKVRMLGQDFALFRNAAGEAQCVSNVCIHRGAALAGGKVSGDMLLCPYHGWGFDGSGVCRRHGASRVAAARTQRKYSRS